MTKTAASVKSKKSPIFLNERGGNFSHANPEQGIPRIKVLGVGGSGSNTVSRIYKSGMKGVHLVALNTDAQALGLCRINHKVLIGKQITGGLGTGMDSSLGEKAAQENKEEIMQSMENTDMVFITCGLGGGTGSGAAPIIAQIAKDAGILTVVFVTTPFSFEGEQRRIIAQQSLKNFQGNADSLLVIPNDKLLKIITEKTTVAQTFEKCDDILKQAVQSVTDLILAPGIINVNFASIASIMKDSGQALFATAKARGENRATKAAQEAINSPLLDFSIKGVQGILFNVSGNDVTLNDIKTVAKIITENANPRAKIIFGAVKNDALKEGEIKITVIATKL